MNSDWIWVGIVAVPTLVIGIIAVVAIVGEKVMQFCEDMGWKARTPYIG